MKPSKDGWPEFTQQNPVKVKVLNHPQLQQLNADLDTFSVEKNRS